VAVLGKVAVTSVSKECQEREPHNARAMPAPEIQKYMTVGMPWIHRFDDDTLVSLMLYALSY
jgi:hypothetical protein